MFTLNAFFAIVLAFLAIFLILLVLVQRGRGGGLAGALGGMGGSSAFGAKAGDVFTRITIVVVAIWIVTCILAGHWAKHRGDLFDQGGAETTSSAPSTDLKLPALPQTPLQTPPALPDAKSAPIEIPPATKADETPAKAAEENNTTTPPTADK